MTNLLTQVRAMLQTTADYWDNLAHRLPAESLLQKPTPTEWSAAECLRHLVDTEAVVFQARLQAFLADQDFPGFDPDSQGTKVSSESDLAELAAEFTDLRAKSLLMLADLQPDDLARQATHGELGRVTLQEMLNEWAGHDLNHTIQAERAIMQPFIAGCGPWKQYFADHVIGDWRLRSTSENQLPPADLLQSLLREAGIHDEPQSLSLLGASTSNVWRLRIADRQYVMRHRLDEDAQMAFKEVYLSHLLRQHDVPAPEVLAIITSEEGIGTLSTFLTGIQLDQAVKSLKDQDLQSAWRSTGQALRLAHEVSLSETGEIVGDQIKPFSWWLGKVGFGRCN